MALAAVVVLVVVCYNQLLCSAEVEAVVVAVVVLVVVVAPTCQRAQMFYTKLRELSCRLKLARERERVRERD